MNPSFIHIGTRSEWGSETPFGIHPEDARHHTYLIGKTGSGKTTLLRNSVLQHLRAGNGLALLDPHGDLADELLDHFPPARADDLVYSNPADLEFPIALNLLARVRRDDRHLVCSAHSSSPSSSWRRCPGPTRRRGAASTSPWSSMNSTTSPPTASSRSWPRPGSTGSAWPFPISTSTSSRSRFGRRCSAMPAR
ncbi:MAG: hypothetical protein FJ387_28210 [Verrucomicrobia bacterium]|nr:hypothetical protein [Verrucomicrobiota bacterium]